MGSCMIIFCFSIAFALTFAEYNELEGDYFEGDLNLSYNPKSRNGILRNKRWTNGVIHYEVDKESGLTETETGWISKAMKEIQDHTCIQFKPKEKDTNVYIILKHIAKGVCSSNVGMHAKGGSIVSIGLQCGYGTIVHELLHTVGLQHEHNRFDRDDFITVSQGKLDTKTFNRQFKNVLKTTQFDAYGIPYNYQSVMHYSSWGVMEAKDPRAQKYMVYKTQGSEGDYEKVRRIYECNGTYPIVPYQKLADLKECKDALDACSKWKDACEFPWWADNYCRQTCGKC